MNQRQSRLRILATSFIIALVAVFTAACGDSNDFVVTNNTNTFANRYLGANSLGAGQTSNLDITVTNSGQASGTLTVNPVSAQTITVGTYAVSGTVNLTTGSFNLSGTIPTAGPFTIVGSLPIGNNAGSYTLSINGQTFAGTIQLASLGTPNPPSNPGGGGEEGQLIFGGTVGAPTFAYSPDFNGVEPPYTTSALISGAFGEGEGGVKSLSIALTEGLNRVFTVSIVDPSGTDLQVNHTYSLAVDSNSAGSFATYQELTGTTISKAWVTDGANASGTATITSLTSTSVTVEFEFDNLTPNSEVAGNGAVGHFDVAGTVTGNFAP